MTKAMGYGRPPLTIWSITRALAVQCTDHRSPFGYVRVCAAKRTVSNMYSQAHTLVRVRGRAQFCLLMTR